MNPTRPRLPLLVPLLLLGLGAAFPSRAALTELTLEQRIAAQAAIERVYYSHQEGRHRSFEEAVPRSLLEEKVRIYLEQSAALEELWNAPVTPRMLQTELQRIAANTRFPERLLEVYRALGNDPVLVQECFIRPILVDRLTRSFFAMDQRIHERSRRRAEHLHADLAGGRIDIHADHPQRTIVEAARRSQEGAHVSHENGPSGDGAPSPRLQLTGSAFARWRSRAPQAPGEVGRLIETRWSFSVAVVLEERKDLARMATYTVPKQTWDDWWESVRRRFKAVSIGAVASPQATLPVPRVAGDGREDRSGAFATEAAGGSVAPCYPEDTWLSMSSGVPPEGRDEHSAVWTGSEMIVWGGYWFDVFQTGGRYDPLTDSWSPTSTVNAPTGRIASTAVWTGEEMIIFGGLDFFGSYGDVGGRYDPVADSWTLMPSMGFESGRIQHSAVWTGEEMIVWGGQQPGLVSNSGARYDPDTDSWSPVSLSGAPDPRFDHAGVWADGTMIVWGGYGGGGVGVATGGRYSPLTDSWSPTSLVSVPSPRGTPGAVWTGTEMIIWAGYGTSGPVNTGGRYNPVTDSWTAVAVSSDTPRPQGQPTVVWTGSDMLAWGADARGARYNPSADAWTRISSVNAPSPRQNYTLVWSGDLMIVWGGEFQNTGGRYDPVADAWTPTSLGSGPSARFGHTAVWTGNQMIIWGGMHDQSGGRYDPLTDSWQPTTTLGAPQGRSSHRAVWTGDEMIVYGGTVGFSGYPREGWRYDPLADTWQSTSTAGAPSGRSSPAVIWTGAQMLVWSGYTGSSPAYVNDGGRYDPAADAWTGMSTIDAPSPRVVGAAAWTGSEMLVWGGRYGSLLLADGGRYDPSTDTWGPIAAEGAPAVRTGYSTVWTGREWILWGGREEAPRQVVNTGLRYDPSRDTWQPTSQVGAPSVRYSHSALWAGNRMTIWGGIYANNLGYLNSGGRYDPETDSWVATSEMNAPFPRADATAVWTGNLMLVWGGEYYGLPLDAGGRYSPGEPDEDGDGFSRCLGDCDDADALVYPGAEEVCNGTDDDCDGIADQEGDSLCDDGSVCTGAEICAGSAGCQPGIPLDCDDGYPCSIDRCDPVAGCFSEITDPSCREPKGQGYYRRLCGGDHPEEMLTQANVGCISATQTFATVSTIEAMCEILTVTPRSDKCLQAEAQFLSARLNLCKGRIEEEMLLDSLCTDHATVGESLGHADGLLSGSARTFDDCVHAQCESEEINSGVAVAPVLSVETASPDGAVLLSWSQPLGTTTSSPPVLFDVWRRPLGEGPFVKVAVVDGLSYLDEDTGGVGFEYQVTAP